MSLSPFGMKNLLHHILSGKEFGVERSSEFYCSLCIDFSVVILVTVQYPDNHLLDCY